MAYTTIDKPTDYFNTVLYTGNNSSSHSITGLDFQPDWVWIKPRNGTDGHVLTDSVRGALKRLRSEGTNAEDTLSGSLSSFDSDGFTVGNAGEVNSSSYNFVAWNWLASNTTASNTDGSITSSVSANTTSGFSIVSYTATGSTATIGHGLGAVPNWILVKKRAGGTARDWAVYHSANTSAPETEILYLNNTDATADSSVYWNDTAPTSSVFTVGTGNEVNESSGNTYIAYCFAEKKGYSKFGSYTGNGNADGTFVYTGFKPAFVMTKRSSNTENWYIIDNKRSPFNPPLNALSPNLSHAEDTNATGRIQDFLSNGFKLRTSDTAVNGSGDSYIYMAFSESPFVTSLGIPTTAR